MQGEIIRAPEGHVPGAEIPAIYVNSASFGLDDAGMVRLMMLETLNSTNYPRFVCRMTLNDSRSLGEKIMELVAVSEAKAKAKTEVKGHGIQ